jgi:hypothetical protein
MSLKVLITRYLSRQRSRVRVSSSRPFFPKELYQVSTKPTGVQKDTFLEEGLFGVGTAALLLLFIGIHNAWDAVTYHVFVKKS